MRDCVCIPHDVATSCLKLANVTISDWEFTTENHKHGKHMALLDCTVLSGNLYNLTFVGISLTL